MDKDFLKIWYEWLLNNKEFCLKVGSEKLYSETLEDAKKQLEGV